MEDFEGKVSIITGGALGIGRGAAIGFAQAGANVVIADVNVDAGQETEARAKAFSHGARFVEADVARTADCQRVVSETTSAFGRVDVLVNNVGIQPVESYKNVEETPEAIWDRILDVNLKSAFLMSKYAIPEMRKQGGGAIINTASVQGLQSQPLVPAYAASKGGILSLTRQMALDYAPENIRVLAVCPGAIDTPLVRNRCTMGRDASAGQNWYARRYRQRDHLSRNRQGEFHDRRARLCGRRFHGAGRMVQCSRRGRCKGVASPAAPQNYFSETASGVVECCDPNTKILGKLSSLCQHSNAPIFQYSNR